MQLHPALSEADLAARAAARQAEREARSAQKAADKLQQLALAPSPRATICPVPAMVPRIRPQPVLIQPSPIPQPRVRTVTRIKWDDPWLLAIGTIVVLLAGYFSAAIQHGGQ
jgi:hypothetical protein